MRGVDGERRDVQGLSLCFATRLHERADWPRFAKNQPRSLSSKRRSIARMGFGLRAGHQGLVGEDGASRSMNKTFVSSRAPEPVGAFPHAKRVGDLLFLSGIGPRVRGSKEIPGVTLDAAGNVVSYDIETQCRAVFENVRLVLEDAGATWQDIIDVTVFLTNMKKDFPIYNRLYAEYFAGPNKPNPTRTTVEVTALPTPIAIELKVIAAVQTATD